MRYKEYFWIFIGSFAGIGLITFLQSYAATYQDDVFLIGSFGASSVLIYGAFNSPLSQPRNFVGGQLISAIIGVTVYKLMPDIIWLTAPLAVSLSILMMQLTNTLHPPGGATALVAVIGSEKIKTLGYVYVLSPVLTGTLIIFVVAFVINNLVLHRDYPTDRRWIDYIKKILGKQ